MSEPLRLQFLQAVASVCVAALAATTYTWGAFPAHSVDRRALDLTRLGDKLRVLVLDDAGAYPPLPESHDGDYDDRFNFMLCIQVNDAAGPSTWGHRALETLKGALDAACATYGALRVYTKQRITY